MENKKPYKKRPKQYPEEIDRVVDHLVDQMVQTLLTYVADIHGGALAHRLKPFENLDIRSGIFFFLLFYVF